MTKTSYFILNYVVLMNIKLLDLKQIKGLKILPWHLKHIYLAVFEMKILTSK